MKKEPLLHFGVVTLMPEMFHALDYGVIGRAIKNDLAAISYWNPRDWATDVHKTVDDKPYGGGPGMVMMYQPLALAIESAKRFLPENCKTIYLSPQGKKIEQKQLNAIVNTQQNLLFVAGRYEGIDERIIDHYIDEEWSIGDFVISGGELAAMIVMDALIRLLPGALGHQASNVQESFMQGLLDYPHYTRPDTIHGMQVPAVLLSGDHQAIERWRKKQSLGKTWLKKPELLRNLDLSELEQQLLTEFKTLKE